MNLYKYLLLGVLFTIAPILSYAQDKVANIDLNFATVDSQNVCKALVTSEGQPVKEVTIKFFVKRLYSLLPISDKKTDENGVVSFEFPKDIPADKSGSLTVIAKIIDDDNFANTQVEKKVNWGVLLMPVSSDKMERSLYGSRAPIFFIAATDFIFLVIWIVLIYIVFQVFKIKKISSLNKIKN